MAIEGLLAYALEYVRRHGKNQANGHKNLKQVTSKVDKPTAQDSDQLQGSRNVNVLPKELFSQHEP